MGVVYASWMTGNADVSLSVALALAIGIAIQNFPEGAHFDGGTLLFAFSFTLMLVLDTAI